MTAPRVTVLMAVHDDERFVGGAVRSVLDQSFTDFELVIVDDASTDRSREIAAAFDDRRIRVVDQADRVGLTRSLNRGLACARGEYVARLDANDASRRDRLARQVAFLDARPDVVAVGSRARQVRRSGAIVRRPRGMPSLTRAGIDWASMFSSPLIHSAAMFRRRSVEQLGGYDEQFVTAQDMELWSRLATVGRLANLGEELIDLRVDPTSISGYRAAWRRLRMVPMVSRVLGANIRRLTRQAALPEGWPEVWVRLIYSDPRLRSEEAVRALDLLVATRARFADVCPESRDSREVADQIASACEHAAFDLCRTDRRAALRVFARAVAISAGHAARDLPRFGARLLFGNAPVRLWRRLAHR